jgi:hypothetical protein
MGARGVLRTIQGDRLGWWCPGCKELHMVNTGPSGWTFNGDYDKPTFAPSVLVTGGHYMDGWMGPGCWCTFDRDHPEFPPTRFECVRCHTFIRDGQIQFLPDCSHSLAGQTVAMEAMHDE